MYRQWMLLATVDYGAWQGEVSWELVLDGDTLLTGGAPFSGLLEVSWWM